MLNLNVLVMRIFFRIVIPPNRRSLRLLSDKKSGSNIVTAIAVTINALTLELVINWALTAMVWISLSG